MKFVEDKDCGVVVATGFGFEPRVVCIPTTDEEKEFIKSITDENGNIRPSIYDKLYKYGDIVYDNVFFYGDDYDETNCDDVMPEAIMTDVNRLRNKTEDKWDVERLPFAKPSTLCLINLFYHMNHDHETANSMIDSINYFYENKGEEK